MSLTAVVIGTGWAGEGHVRALKAAGVEVAALCGHTREAAIAKAHELAVSEVRFDWRRALEELHPDIVTVAVPPDLHREISETALSMGINTICEKPLAANAEDARAMVAAAERSRARSAYAATSRYAPAVLHARLVVDAGLVGELCEVESTLHLNLPRLLAYTGWQHELSRGGGLLLNIFTHKIAQVLAITPATVVAAAGEGRRRTDRAPVGPTFHDSREVFGPAFAMNEQQARSSEWRAVDADLGYTVLLRLRPPAGREISALFQATATPNPFPDYLALYGTRGTLVLTGGGSPDRLAHFDQERGSWEELPLPREIADSLPEVGDPIQRDWNQLFRLFAASVANSGEVSSEGDYPSFLDGCLAVEIIDSVRDGNSLPRFSDSVGAHKGRS